MKGLDILNKTTWNKRAMPVTAITLTEQDQAIINTYFAPVLGPAKYQASACAVAIAMAQLVDYKMHCPVRHVKQRAVSYEYWRKFLEGRFGLRVGNRNKVAAILKAAEACGIIKPWCGYSKAMRRATIYETGKRLKIYMEHSVPQEPLYIGSILFAYHFWKEGSEDVNKDDKIGLLIGEE